MKINIAEPSAIRWACAIMLFMLSATASTHSLAQGYHHIKYEFEQRRNGQVIIDYYDALLIDDDFGGGTMRVKYKRPNKSLLIEQDIKSEEVSYKGPEGVEVKGWIYTGDSVRFISKDKSQYFPDVIKLRKNATDDFYSPDSVYTITPNGKLYGKITFFKTLQDTIEIKSILKDFAWGTVRAAGITNIPDFTKATLHLITVSNTDDAENAECFQKNERKIAHLFEQSARAIGLKLNRVDVKGSKFLKPNVVEAIENLKVKKGVDIVIFYYTGHGFRFYNQDVAKDPWPNLILINSGIITDIRDNAYSLGDVRDKLNNKKARLTLVFGECCNVDSYVTPRTSQPTVRIAASRNFFDPEKLRQLFAIKGSLAIATCKPGQASFYDDMNGGYFGVSLYQTMLSMTGFNDPGTPPIAATLSWTNILRQAFELTTNRSKADDRDGEQVPFMIPETGL